MTDDILTYYGKVAILKIRHTEITVSINNRIINVPREPFCAENGVWGTAYNLTDTFYQDDDTRISDEVRHILYENLPLGHINTPCIFE